MSNVINLPPNDKSGLYKGELHINGGIQTIVDGSNVNNGRVVEIESEEYYLCPALMQSDKIYEFKNKTNKEILDALFQDSKCVFRQGFAVSGSFIICRLVVLDSKKNNRTGTAKELVNLLQSEKSCNVTEDAADIKNQRLGGTQSGERVFVAPKGTVISKTPSHRAKDKLKKIGIPFLSLYAIGWGGNEWYSLIYEKDAQKIKSIKGSSTQNSLNGSISSRHNNDALEKIFMEQKEKLENDFKPKKNNEFEEKSKSNTDNWQKDVISKEFDHPKYGRVKVVGTKAAGSDFGRIKQNRVLAKKVGDTYDKGKWLNLDSFFKDVKDDTKELKDMIELLEMTVKENPKDHESNDMLELLKMTLSDKGVSKKDNNESTLVKIYHKLENDDKFGEGYLKSVWSNHTPPTVVKTMILDKYKKLVKELSNDEMQKLVDKKHLLTEDEYKLHHGDKEFVVKYVSKERMNLRPKMQGQTKTWVFAKDRDDVLKKIKNKKEFPDFGKLISIKPTENKYNEGGNLDTNVVSKQMIAVNNTDLSGLIFANKRGGFFYPAVELVDINNYDDAKLPLSVLLLFSEKQYKTPDYIETKEVIGAVIPSNMTEAKVILTKHDIPFATYELNVPNIKESKINAVRELSKTHNNILIEND
jgi:hypothetical protein